MEVKINVEELTQESKNNKIVSENHLNNTERKVQNETCDENERLVDTKEFNISNASGNNVISNIEQCTANSSRDFNCIDNTTFKKPNVIIGSKRSRTVHKVTDTCSPGKNDCCVDHELTSQEHLQDLPFPYIEPSWGGKPKENYEMEVLKSGVIIQTILLSDQSFHVVGRLPSCHLTLAHPTISRYHAILQYRSEEDNENTKGFYVYDLGSTHGTFWNGNLIKPNVYIRVRGGHMLRFGCSQRKYILQAPPEDQEEESQYSLTELKKMRASELERQGVKDKVEDKASEGIDWGMGEDANEETDLQENPYACTTDEDLVLEDPKKTLRGWFEREGYDLHYQTEEKGLGQFLCWVDLPMEDIVGHSVRAEAVVKGKKKEAVIQCAWEACKILDKYGLLRQANHEARKRKTRNWEAEDYYDSDEDNFLDRTGSVEKKREQRMRMAGKLEEKVETYDSLLEKHKEVTKRISYLSASIKNWQNANSAKKEITEEDELDAFMSSLSSYALSKSDIAKMKLELQSLQKEEIGLIKLLNLTRPANLPSLSGRDIKEYETETVVHVVQDAPVETKKIHASLLHRKKNTVQGKQVNQHIAAKNKSFISNEITDVTVKAESVEEVDSDDSDEVISNSSHARLDEEDFKLQCSTNTSIPINTKSFKKTGKQQKHEVQVTKKLRQEERKIDCDQDVYKDNYSMWVPPQDQAGDGKTSLNEKYGY